MRTKTVRIVKSPQGGIEVQVFASNGDSILEWVRIPQENISELIEQIRRVAETV